MSIFLLQGDDLNVKILRGDSFSMTATYTSDGTTPINLTGYTAELVNSSFIAIPATVTIPTPANGQVLVAMSTGQTVALTDRAYRLRVTSGATVITLIKGRLDVS